MSRRYPIRSRRRQSQRLSLTSRRGFSLIEVLIGVILLSAALMGLAGAASAGLMQSTRSRDDTQFWGDAQTILDSLVARPYGTAATTDSTTVRRRKIKWIIASPATAPQKITLIVWRRGYQLTRQNVASRAVPDTVVFYLARRVPGS